MIDNDVPECCSFEALFTWGLRDADTVLMWFPWRYDLVALSGTVMAHDE